MISANFKKVFGYSLLFFIGIYIMTVLFGTAVDSLSSKLETVSVEKTVETGSSAIWWIILAVLVLQIIFILVAASLYAFTENKIWCTIYGKKADFKSSAKLLLLSLIMFLILMILFLFFGWLFLSAINMGLISRVIFFLIALLGGYMLYVSYISFTHTRKIFLSIKESFTKSFSNLDKTSVLLLIAGLFAIIIDLFVYWIAAIPEPAIFTISSVLLSLYAVWFKISLAKALKSIKF